MVTQRRRSQRRKQGTDSRLRALPGTPNLKAAFHALWRERPCVRQGKPGEKVFQKERDGGSGDTATIEMFGPKERISEPTALAPLPVAAKDPPSALNALRAQPVAPKEPVPDQISDRMAVGAGELLEGETKGIKTREAFQITQVHRRAVVRNGLFPVKRRSLPAPLRVEANPHGFVHNPALHRERKNPELTMIFSHAIGLQRMKEMPRSYDRSVGNNN